mgnify:CR=1 FL=1
MGKKSNFNSKIGVILAAAGSAVGLGNIWKFPYMVGENGGSAFLLIYLVCCLLIGLPIMIAEFSIGKRAGVGLEGAFRTLTGNKHWQWLSALGFIVSLLLLSFYPVVTGWCILHVFRLPDNTITQIIFGGLSLLITCIISWYGVQNGLERMSKILMPIFIILLLLLIGKSLMLSGSNLGIQFLFDTDFSKINSNVILNAMGQSFFSLSVGVGVILTFGSYMPKSQNIIATSVQVVTLDTLISILSGLAIFPAVFALGFNPAEGPQLVFDILPKVFGLMSFGEVWTTLFFTLLSLAAITSLLSMLEVAVTYVSDKTQVSRKKSISLLFILLFASMCLCVLFPYLFDFYDNLVSQYLMPIGGLAITIFVGWFTTKNDTIDELKKHSRIQVNWPYTVFFVLIRYIIPLAILLIFLNGLGIFERL